MNWMGFLKCILPRFKFFHFGRCWEIEMKKDVVSKGLSDLQSALTQAESDFLGSYYDAVVADQPAPTQAPGSFTQADIDAAVADARVQDGKALTDSQAADAQALSDAVAKVQVQLDATTQALADMTAKDKKDSAASLALKASIASLQAAIDALSAISDPAPEAPAPDAPSDGSAPSA